MHQVTATYTISHRKEINLVLSVIFGPPFVKWFALCYQTVVCPVHLSCMSVMLVYCGQTVKWIKIKLGMEAGLGPSHIVLDGAQLPLRKRGTAAPQFSAHVCCVQTAGWIKMPLSTDYGRRSQTRRHCVRWGPSSR